MAFLSRLHHVILSRGGGFVKMVHFRPFTIGEKNWVDEQGGSPIDTNVIDSSWVWSTLLTNVTRKNEGVGCLAAAPSLILSTRT